MHTLRFAKALVTGLALAGTLAIQTPAEACPNCAVGRQARTEVFRESFGFNLFVALLPFLMIGAICLRAEAIGRQAAGKTPPLESDRERVTRRGAHS